VSGDQQAAAVFGRLECDVDEALSSILSNEKPPVEAAPVEVQKDDKPTVEAVEAAPVTAATSAAKDESQPTEQKKEPLKPAELAAIIDERRKRQAVEQELAELKSKAAPEKPDFFADPEKAVEVRVNEIVAPIREKFFKQSITAAASAHSDFEQAAEAFAAMVDKDPSLHSQWLASDDPGEFIYQRGTNTPEHREKLTSTLQSQLAEKEALIAEKEARIAALMAELEGKSKAQTELAAVPKSLNNVASGAAPSAADTADDDITSIVRFKTG
jgi:hypothetical protein